MRTFVRNGGGAALLAVALGAVACGSDNSIVDGSCRDGYVEVGARCEKVASGAVASDSSAPARSGESNPSAVGPGERSGASGSEASRGLSGASGAEGGPAVSTDAGSAASPDATTGANADAGGVEDVDAAPAIPACAAPLFVCGDACLDGLSDPRNCGACGKICRSNICVAGECQGATPGDVVVIGHDLSAATNMSSEADVVLNAVTIPTSNPLRVLAFDGGEPAPVTAHVRNIVARGSHRTVSFASATPTTLESSTLARDYDVVLLHGAGDDAIALGTRWAGSLATFTKKGGVVVALDRDGSTMPELLRGAGIFPTIQHVTLASGAHATVTAPADAVGTQVVSPYAPRGMSVGFTGVTFDGDTFAVVRQVTPAGDGLPMVVHRIVR